MKLVCMIIKTKIHKKMKKMSQAFVIMEEAKELCKDIFGENTLEYNTMLNLKIKRKTNETVNNIAAFYLSFTEFHEFLKNYDH